MVFDVNNHLCQRLVSQPTVNLAVFGVLWKCYYLLGNTASMCSMEFWKM